MKPGIYDIEINEYHSSEGLSRSALSYIKESPLLYWHAYLNPEREKRTPTASMRIGSCVHGLVLEPHKFNEGFAVLQDLDYRTKQGKEHKALIESQAESKIILKHDEHELSCAIAATINANNQVQKILNAGDKAACEKSFYWEDKDTGLLLKARPDIYNQSIAVLADLKITSKPTKEEFARTIIYNDYHIQAAMQIDAVYELTKQKINNFIFIVSSFEPPHEPFLYMIGEEIIESGRRLYKDILKIAKKCFETQNFALDREVIQKIYIGDYLLSRTTITSLMEAYQCQM